MRAAKAFNRLYRQSIRFLKKAFISLGQAVYPEGLVCIGCQNELTDDGYRYMSICADCFDKLPFRTAKTCEICGKYINPSEGTQCKDCIKTPKPYEKLYTLFDYNGLVKNIIVNYKIYSNTYLYEYIAKFLIDFYKANDIYPDLVCYVPMTHKAIKRRGFDHLKKVCEYFAEHTGLSLEYPLVRVKESFKTKKHSQQERMTNIQSAFDVLPDVCLADKTILLIDDVVTTGATISECAKALKTKARAKSVIVMSLAMT